ncbi:RagB/SusD family nutrient uptake outer membrane protein [uncultured Bacteroides sp.]|uniref:RagB/SusD family nutrient uptake outer membrane protein n=1 Tax=uncultured Bacteroides sp. TaxID=162156 RepID=UPI002AAAA640|nr:RagB/SusD family nutrient uptake outer membrane protein [uncultured Bacteroides sp.]
MKIKKIIPIYTLITGLLFVTSCELQDIPDANNPSVSSVTSNATVGQLQNLITGLESRSKEYVGTASNAFGTFDRDIWYFNGADPRNVQYWTGQAEAVPSSTFYGVDAAYTGPYSAIKQANVLISAVNNTSSVTETQKNAIIGFAKTIQGYQYLVPANSLYQNGIRIDVSDPLNPGPFVSYTEALTAIKKILDEGYTALSNAGSTLPFTLTKGYTDFNTPAGLGKVNRALAARVAIYQKDWQGALDALSKSFFNLNGDLNIGPAHVYGNPPETYNPLYFVLDASYNSGAVVHPSLIADALPGDSRVKTKFFHRTTPLVSTAGKVALSSEYQDKRWADATSPIKYIRNEELVLIYAEASAQLNKTVDAVTAINIIRSSANLAPYTGATDLGSLITEILFQRRYSLWFEPAAHRWIDLRRYGRLNEIPVALDKGVVFTQLAIPISEVNWDKFKNK